MDEEKLSDIVTGVLFDFAGFLTTGKEEIVLSKEHDATPAIRAIIAFFNSREVFLSNSPNFEWHSYCKKIVRHD